MKHALLGIVSLLTLITPIKAQSIEAVDVIKKAINANYYAGNSVRTTVDMDIYDNQGRKRVRRLTMLRSNLGLNDGTQKYYVYFRKPSDVKKMVFMAWKNVGRDDDRWLYLPALDLVKRIAASDERTSFVGSHFYYEDVSGREVTEDKHSLVKETDAHYVIKSMPMEPNKVEFSYYVNWVDKKTFLPMKVEYYDGNNKTYRTYEVKTVKTIDTYPTAVDVQMENSQTGGKTILHYSNIKYKLNLPKSIFTERYLRKPARRYLK